jgi:hypothetical protein
MEEKPEPLETLQLIFLYHVVNLIKHFASLLMQQQNKLECLSLAGVFTI